MKTAILIATVCFLATTAPAAPDSALEALQRSRKTYNRNLRTLSIQCSARQQKAFAEYRVGLRRALSVAEDSADFEGTKAILAEEKRFVAEKTIPESPTDDLAPAVVKVQNQYHSTLREAEKDRDQKTVDLTRRYLTALEALMKRLLRQRKMAEAAQVDEAVKRAKEKIAALEPPKKAQKPKDTSAASTNAPPTNVR